MDVATIIHQYSGKLLARYKNHMLPSHRRALDAMLACRKQCGEIHVQCEQCHDRQIFPLSCGHRSCPKCQNADTTAWIDRQCDKLLPVPYFMVTFTIPSELRKLAWRNQRLFYKILFDVAVDTLNTLGMDSKHLGAKLGLTGVLHTHTRRLEYHPHIHFIVPGGGISKSHKKSFFKRVSTNYFIRGDVIGKVFRGKLIHALLENELSLPAARLPKDWVVNVKHIGKGKPAIEYLSRYLYRGVIREQNIIKNENGKVTFLYRDSETNKVESRVLYGEEFVWKLLTHVLPRGFRRVRDFGFLHPNAKKRLKLIQLILSVKVPINVVKRRTKIICKLCSHICTVVDVVARKIPISGLFPYKSG